MSESLTCIILAAGKGSRMNSSIPKVMHPLGGQPMLSHIISTTEQLEAKKTVVVASPDMPTVEALVQPHKNVTVAIQKEQLGTADAVLSTKENLKKHKGTVLVLFGDTPFITADTLKKMIALQQGSSKSTVVILGMRPEDTRNYGRILCDDNGDVAEIVEYKDATETQLEIDLCNSGIMAIDAEHALELIEQVTPHNTQGEYYLTDLVKIARQNGLRVSVIEGDEIELSGINSRTDLAIAEEYLQSFWRQQALENGVTMADPATVYFSYDTQLGQDITIAPNVVIGPGVSIENNVEIKPFCSLQQTKIKQGACIGPFAHLRPGTEICENARVGNFVEIKNTTLAKGAKANHLTYLGDTEVGPDANVGAGTITCNYDGFNKSKTIIEEGAFIGSNTSLVAPVRIGKQAIIGAGSVITKDVPEHAIAVARGQQQEIAKGAERFRAKRTSPSKGAK